LGEALATVRMLETQGRNFSVGLAQINRANLAPHGLQPYERAFEPCANVVAGSRILAECHTRAGGDWGKAFSCYYSGNFETGFRHGYVQKIFASIAAAPSDNVPDAEAAIRFVETAAGSAVARRGDPGRYAIAGRERAPVVAGVVARRSSEGSAAPPGQAIARRAGLAGAAPEAASQTSTAADLAFVF